MPSSSEKRNIYLFCPCRSRPCFDGYQSAVQPGRDMKGEDGVHLFLFNGIQHAEPSGSVLFSFFKAKVYPAGHLVFESVKCPHDAKKHPNVSIVTAHMCSSGVIRNNAFGSFHVVRTLRYGKCIQLSPENYAVSGTSGVQGDQKPGFRDLLNGKTQSFSFLLYET